MKKDDPFGFDMSVSTAKKNNPRGRRGMSGAFETSTRKCEHAGCVESGKYRAPKSPDILDDYFWFCKEHVREYNLKWNFFDGNSEEELQRQMDSDRVWERETKPLRSSEEQRAWAPMLRKILENLSPGPRVNCHRLNVGRWIFWKPKITGPRPKFARPINP